MAVGPFLFMQRRKLSSPPPPPPPQDEGLTVFPLDFPLPLPFFLEEASPLGKSFFPLAIP